MELKNLLGTPNKDLTVPELEEKFKQLKLLKVVANKPKKTTAKVTKTKKTTTRKSNKDKQLEDMISKIGPEKMAAFLKELG